ncbi:hypothetical protein PPYR_10965 [Photinus pyralis]|uniref:Saposin B-type domain-containing protein n=1 Tax=Photinus pyralis TaxID=7054 RepID=A0A5N4AHW6_PHOPY|nr:hypothetical protein PPYR_10965 [Photinus pyralis]
MVCTIAFILVTIVRSTLGDEVLEWKPNWCMGCSNERNRWSQLYELASRVVWCTQRRIWVLSSKELDPFMAGLDCDTIPISDHEECLNKNVKTLSERKMVKFLQQLESIVHNHYNILDCIQNALLNICPRLCEIAHDMCPGGILNLEAATIAFVQGRHFLRKCY